jgi:hypothetical protein
MPMKLGMCGLTIGRAAYCRQFGVVEVQQTFYDPPPLATLERWRHDAPGGFEFTMKAWQVITHRGSSRTYRRLRRPFSDQQLSEAGGFRPPLPGARGPWPDELASALCRSARRPTCSSTTFRG